MSKSASIGEINIKQCQNNDDTNNKSLRTRRLSKYTAFLSAIFRRTFGFLAT